MSNCRKISSCYLLWLGLISYTFTHLHVTARQWSSSGTSTRFYDFKVQTMRITKMCKSKDIVTVNRMFPGPVIYAYEDDKIIVKVTNETPYNTTIHWHGVQQRLSCWSDGPSYITQCPIQSGQSFTYKFVLVKQKGTMLWHAHVSWLRGTVYGAIVVYPKIGIPYPFKKPYKEQIIILGEYWHKDVVQLEREALDSGGAPTPADAFTINGYPGPSYNCSNNDVYKMEVVPGKKYLLRIINAALNSEHFFTIANHKLTIVEVDGEYTKPFTVNRLMIAPGQTINVLITADQPIKKYSMAMGPYMSAKNVSFQKLPAIAYFQYTGTTPNQVVLSAQLPIFNDSFVVKTVMDGLRSLNPVNVPMEIDVNLFFTIGLNVEKCHSLNPKKNCKGPNGGVLGASVNNISFINPKFSLLQAYYNDINGHFTEDFPDLPLKVYDYVNGAPNNIPNDTQSLIGTRTKVLEFGSRVELILQDTGTVSIENHPIHIHGYSFYVVGYGTGNYDSSTAKLNLVDPPYMNTIGVPVGGWAAIRFVADNPGVWFMHCHLEIHMSWGLSMAFIVKNGKGKMQTLPPPPAGMPMC
ncbi:Multicopper oxidase [Macleaya cordata]|uniref:Laccase n=1 Tax=Macleaya cordata TaxID=56857 RepID=A0A200Q7B0_MACCD|nr:Multicopper oxidase [Macleaya cordata]